MLKGLRKLNPGLRRVEAHLYPNIPLLHIRTPSGVYGRAQRANSNPQRRGAFPA